MSNPGFISRFLTNDLNLVIQMYPSKFFDSRRIKFSIHNMYPIYCFATI